MSVTIVAGRDVRGDIGAPERHGLAMVSLAIVGETVLVALAADLVAGRLEWLPGGLLDLVGAVAVGAHRAAWVALGEKLAVHALVVDVFDAEVALPAGLGDVRVVCPR